VENRGAALGILQNQRVFFIVITIVFCIILFYILYFYKHHDFFSRFACIVIIAGGIGNLVDRIRLHFVVDYISVSFYSPVFNFADICVVAGVIAALIHILFTNRDKKREAAADPAPEVSALQAETPSQQLSAEAPADRETEPEQEKAAELEKGALDEQNASDHGAGE
jgi:signal peptidase II